MRTLVVFIVAIGLIVLIGNAFVDADPPPVMTYQGYLTDKNGEPLDKHVDITFSLYKFPSGGSPSWTETHSVGVVNGLFWVPLGSINPLNHTYFSSTPRFLGISVDGDPEISPRTYIGSVGFAYRIGTIDGAEGGDLSGDLTLSGSLQVNGATTLGSTVSTPSGVTLQSTGDTLRIVSGVTSIVIRPDGAIILESDSISIVSHGSLELSATDELKLSAYDVNIEADHNIAIDADQTLDLDAGLNATLDATMNITVNSGSNMDLSGSTVDVTGGVTDINGGMVYIN